MTAHRSRRFPLPIQCRVQVACGHDDSTAAVASSLMRTRSPTTVMRRTANENRSSTVAGNYDDGTRLRACRASGSNLLAAFSCLFWLVLLRPSPRSRMEAELVDMSHASSSQRDCGPHLLRRSCSHDAVSRPRILGERKSTGRTRYHRWVIFPYPGLPAVVAPSRHSPSV
jgi:hypothetical protein